MILVTEAGYHGWVAFSACSTLPLSTSTRIVASAAAGDRPSAIAAQAVKARTSVRVGADRAKSIRARGPVVGAGLRNNARFTGGLVSHLNRRRNQKQNGSFP